MSCADCSAPVDPESSSPYCPPCEQVVLQDIDDLAEWARQSEAQEDLWSQLTDADLAEMNR